MKDAPFTLEQIVKAARAIDGQLLDLHCRADRERKPIQRYAEYEELNELRQLAGALRHGTLDETRFNRKHVELCLRQFARIGLA